MSNNMLRNKKEYETFIRLEYLYRGFLEAFEEEIGDVYYDAHNKHTSYRYYFSNKTSLVRVKKLTRLDDKDKQLNFRIDFNSNFDKFKRWYDYQGCFNGKFESDCRVIHEIPDVIEKFKWLLKYKKSEHKYKLSVDNKLLLPFSSVRIYIDTKFCFRESKHQYIWYVEILSQYLEIDLYDPNVGKKVYDFFKTVLFRIDLASEE